MSYDIQRAHPFFDMTRSIVEREINSSATITFVSEIDLASIETERRAAATRGELKPSYTAFVAKALAMAMREFPYANCRALRRAWLPFSSTRLQRFTSCDVTVAIERDVPGAEVATFVDVIRDADRSSLAEISARLRELASSDENSNRQWREYRWIVNNLPRWLAAFVIALPVHFPKMWAKYRGGAAMVSSPSKYGVDMLIGTWTAPLGCSFGLVKQRPIVRDGQVVAGPTFMLTLNWDRRVMAGAQAARFFKRIVDHLENACGQQRQTVTAKNDNEVKSAECVAAS